MFKGTDLVARIRPRGMQHCLSHQQVHSQEASDMLVDVQ